MNDLDNIRKEISRIDMHIIDLLAERVSLIPAVGKYKKENDIPILQPEREAQILRALQEKARNKGVDPELVQKIFDLIFANSREIQKMQ